MRTNTSTTIFDGAPINEVWEGWDFGRVPGLDSLQEIHVETNNSSAKFARPLTVLLTSKSGSNQFHGAVFYTNRNSGYGVARRRQDLFTKPPYSNRNEYGFSGGGPVYIPKVYDGRNKTFFFASYEAVRSLSYATNSYNVPTEAMRNGDFTNLIDSAGRRITLYDPLTTTATWSRQPLTYQGITNRIDPNRISKLAKTLFAMTPLPNLPSVNPLVDFNLIIPVATPSTQDTTTLRLDHRFFRQRPDLRAHHSRQKRSPSQYHTHAAERHRRFRANRDFEPPLAEFDCRSYLGAHRLADLDQRGIGELFAGLPLAWFGRSPHQLCLGSRPSESFSEH
jgi:hypothetical protein